MAYFDHCAICNFMIKCAMCEKELKQITRNHLLRHDITVAQYREKFPNAPLQDESILLKGEKNPFFGKTHTDEIKQKLSKRFTGKPNPKAAQKIAKLWREKEGVYRKMMASDSYRSTMSKATKAHWNSSESDDHRQKNSESLKRLRPSYTERLAEVQITDSYRNLLSDSITTMWATLTPEAKNARIEKQLTSVMKNGTMSSKGEDVLFELLKTQYPETKRFIWFHPSQTGSKNLWNIDFFIPEIKTYVQFDGVYWHGLDRPIEIIRESNSKRDKTIYKKWSTDHEQDAWFEKTNRRLIRVTDIDFKKDANACLQKIKGHNV